MAEDTIWFVLYSDGTWGGWFGEKDVAAAVASKGRGQVVKGRWFTDYEMSKPRVQSQKLK